MRFPASACTVSDTLDEALSELRTNFRVIDEQIHQGHGLYCCFEAWGTRKNVFIWRLECRVKTPPRLI